MTSKNQQPTSKHHPRIKQKLRLATCTVKTPILENPKCEPDPSCCKEVVERNPFTKSLGDITWPTTANGLFISGLLHPELGYL
jgi:hypothetical protein